MSKEVLITGSSGLVGSNIVDRLSQYSFHGIGRSDNPDYPGRQNLVQYSQCDILNTKALEKIIAESGADVLVHCAAFFPSVDQIESQRDQGSNSEAWQTNVKASEDLAKICEKHKKHIVLAGTSYVFDGQNGPYTETDDPSDSNKEIMSFYGIVKRDQEMAVMNNCANSSVFRFEMPYRPAFTKPDFARRVLELFSEGKLTSMFSDQTITPIHLDELADAVGLMIESKEIGPFHLASSDITSPYNFASKLIQIILGQDEIQKISEASYANSPIPAGKARRPLKGGLVMGRIVELGYNPKTNEEMIQEFARGFLSNQI